MVRIGIVLILVGWLILPGIASAVLDKDPGQMPNFKADGKTGQMEARHGHGIFVPYPRPYPYPYPYPSPFPQPYYYYPSRPAIVGCWAM